MTKQEAYEFLGTIINNTFFDTRAVYIMILSKPKDLVTMLYLRAYKKMLDRGNINPKELI